MDTLRVGALRRGASKVPLNPVVPPASKLAPSTPWLIVPFQAPQYTRLRLEVPLRGIGNGAPRTGTPSSAIGPGSKFRPDRCRLPWSHPQNGAPSLPKSAAGGPDQRCFPPSVSPLWNPPFLIPPSNSNTPKGGNRRGQQRGVSTGAAEETAGPLSPRGAAPRRPSG